MTTPKEKISAKAAGRHSDYRFVVVGTGGVGKSALTVRFIQGNFLEKYDPTIEDSYLKHIEVDNKACTLDIMDTAGQENYKALRDSYMKKGQGFLLVYSVVSNASFEHAKTIHREILRIKEGLPDIPIVLSANKVDLEEREVDTVEGRSWAKETGMGYIETSAKANTNVAEAFEMLVRLTNDYREKHPEASPVELPKKKGFRCTLF